MSELGTNIDQEASDALNPGLEGGDVDIETEAPKRGRGRPRKATRAFDSAPVSQVAAELDHEADQDLLDWLRGFSSGKQTLRIDIARMEPKMFRGKKTSGHITTLDEEFDEEYLRAWLGGGKYRITPKKMNKHNKWEIVTHRVVEIAGDPKFPSELYSEETTTREETPENVKLSEKAIDMAQNLLTSERARSERLESKSNFDPRLIESITRPMAEQMKQAHENQIAMQKRLDERDRQLLEVMTKKPDRTTSDVLLESLLKDEQSKLNAVREQHASELRMARDSAREDYKRAEDRFTRQLEMLQQTHEREVTNMRTAFDTQIATMKMAQETQITQLNMEIARLRHDLQERTTEIRELRDKKEVSLIDQMANLAQMKQAMETMGMVNAAEPDGGSTLERVVKGVLESPLAQGVAERIASGGTPTQPQSQRPQQPTLTREQILQAQARQRKRQAAQATQAQAGGTQVPASEPVPPPVALPAASVAMAIPFVENAIRNGVSPEEFAQTARHAVPQDILKVIKSHGPDALLDALTLNDESPLATVNGRNFLRAVAKAL